MPTPRQLIATGFHLSIFALGGFAAGSFVHYIVHHYGPAARQAENHRRLLANAWNDYNAFQSVAEVLPYFGERLFAMQDEEMDDRAEVVLELHRKIEVCRGLLLDYEDQTEVLVQNAEAVWRPTLGVLSSVVGRRRVRHAEAYWDWWRACEEIRVTAEVVRERCAAHLSEEEKECLDAVLSAG